MQQHERLPVAGLRPTTVSQEVSIINKKQLLATRQFGIEKTATNRTNNAPPIAVLGQRKLFSVIPVWISLILVFATFAQAVEVVSNVPGVPETIMRAPEAFGPYAGRLIVPDFTLGGGQWGDALPIWSFDPDGGGNELLGEVDFQLIGGTFLPDDFGQFGGRYLTGGDEFQPPVVEYPFTLRTRLVTFDQDGIDDDFAVIEHDVFSDDDGVPVEFPQALTTPLIAPADYGQLAGKLIYTDWTSGVFAFDEAGNHELYFNSAKLIHQELMAINPFGGVFVPHDFGDVGGTLLVTDGTVPIFRGDRAFPILSLDSDGNTSIFTEIPFTARQVADSAGMRQISLVPNGYGLLSGNLLLSISGSYTGGGAGGRLLVLDQQGQIVARLAHELELETIDPRGHFFGDGGKILVSDALGRILRVSPDDFEEVTPLRAGDADQDLSFDQLDLVQVQVAAKYLTGKLATWSEGDWNGAPGGYPGLPPNGDGQFDQIDIVAALQEGIYLAGSYDSRSVGEVEMNESISSDANIDRGRFVGTTEVSEISATRQITDTAAIDLIANDSPSGFDPTYVAVPAPSSLLLILTATLPIMSCRRRRQAMK